ncbi:MAG: hypothetical protein J0H69_16955 [Burkholderiales bacterium]|nr:hypothetical protein [Burkholderiales bacterium]
MDDLTTQENQTTSMDSTIADAWKDISQNLQEPAETVARDHTGKFAKREPAPETQEQGGEEKPAITAAPKPEVTTEEPGTQDQPQEPTSKAPSSWKKEAAALFEALPAAVKDEVLRREGDMHKGLEGYKAKAELGRKFESVVAPYMETINKFGVTPDVAIAELLKIDNLLRTAPPAVKAQRFMALARDYGIDLTQEFDPNAAALQQRMYDLENELREAKQAREQQSSQAVNTEIERFAAEPGHEHFEVVRAHMSALLQAGAAKDLQDAYDQAVYANPQTRATLLAQQQEAARKEAQRKADQARKAAAVNVPSRGVVSAAGAKQTMDESIRAEAERLGLIRS